MSDVKTLHMSGDGKFTEEDVKQLAEFLRQLMEGK